VVAAPLALTQEYDSFRQAMREYQSSDEYRNPTTDQDKVLKEMVDFSLQVSEEQIQQEIAKKTFSKAQNRINSQSAQITAIADQFLQVNADSSKENSVSPALRLSGDEGQKKSSFLQGTGIALTVFGGLGMVSAIQQKSIPSLGLAAWPLTVGILILANDNPNSATIKAGQAFLGTSAAVFGITSLAMGVVAIAGAQDWMKQNEAIKQADPAVKKELSKIESTGNYDLSSQDGKAARELYDEAQKAKVGTAIGVIGFAAFAAATYGMSVWTANLSLTSTPLTPAQALAAKMGRAFAAFEGLEGV
jgi:hypothetical protein